MEEITIKDIAKLCKVGISTVSRAINNHPDINPETKVMIMEVIKKHGYIPNNSARNLKRIEAKTIAILVKGMTNPFFSKMIKVMEEEIKWKHYTLVLHHVEFNEDEVDVALELIKEKRLRGIIFLGGYFSHAQEKLEKLQIPFVLSTVGGAPESISKKNYSSVSVDDEKESFKMVDYLFGLGHQKIAILAANPNDESIGMLRLAGYKRAYQKHGMPCKDVLVRYMKEDIEPYSIQNGYEMAKELLLEEPDISAIYAISDLMAIGACRAVIETGKRIPEDYSVVGFDGIDMGYYYNPSITTIRQPVEEMAKATIKLLFAVLSGREKHQHKIFKADLIIRESSSGTVLQSPVDKDVFNF